MANLLSGLSVQNIRKLSRERPTHFHLRVLKKSGMNSKPSLRLCTLIADETSGAITLNRLAELINEANREAKTGCLVNRKILAKIKNDPQKVGLTLNTLIALNTYFHKRGLGLQQLPILETPGVLQVLLNSPRTVFMLGAKARPEERRTYINRWDTRSLARLLTQAQSYDIHREFEIEDVLWRSPVDPTSLQSERWHHILDDERASVISIGSPMASLSSEVMLARMFGVQPFVTPKFKAGKQVPFFFSWLPKTTGDFRSAFGLTWRELKNDHPLVAARLRKNQVSAFILDGVPHGVPNGGNSWTMHGIIAAQRRAAGNVWVVVSGLTGPATFGTAKMVKQITAELPWSNGHNSKVLWMAVRVKIVAGEPNPLLGDSREVTSVEFEGKPKIWPEDGAH